MDLIEKAKQVAQEAHKGQKYKGHDYYTYHILGVLSLLEYHSTDAEVITAILHDTIEDSDVTVEDIHIVFGRCIADAVETITKVSGEYYDEYIEHVKTNSIARKVKIYDAHFNLTECLKDGDIKRAKKYAKVIFNLTET